LYKKFEAEKNELKNE
jgi:phage-related tail protein